MVIDQMLISHNAYWSQGQYPRSSPDLHSICETKLKVLDIGPNMQSRWIMEYAQMAYL